MPSPQFELATLEIEKVNATLSNDELLLLYAYFKIANGVDFATAPKPGMFDLKGKAKYNAWSAELDKGTKTPAQGEQKYIAAVEEYKKAKGFDPKRTTKADGTAIEQAKLTKFDALAKQLGKAY